MARPAKSSKTYFEKLEEEIKTSNSPLSLVLGALIILVVGILIFNFFSQRQEGSVGPAQEIQQVDVSPDNLPGKYTVKEDDTLFTIAEHYYKDGYKFEDIAKANSLSDVNTITVGQVLEIPKLTEVAQTTPTPAGRVIASPIDMGAGTGGGDTTIWGPKITADTYTVVEGDWLSTIAARAYDDIFAYTKIAAANDIKNPDLILPGQVLKLPR